MENQQLTGKEKYTFGKEEKEKEQRAREKSRKIKKISLIILPIVLLVAGIFLIINFLPDKNQPGNPKIEIAPAEYDAGQVPINGGLVKKTFEVKNSGIGALKIENIWTSCMCTKAVLKVGDKTSPEFGMPEHGSSPAFWSEEIKAGETAELEVIFDPLAHGPQGIGQIVRAIYLATNDPEKTKAEILFSANVIP